jgi:hypothetical protein
MAQIYRGGKHYRERAEECRVLAEILATVELREQMLTIAADYERMADTADKLTYHASDDVEVPTLR